MTPAYQDLIRPFLNHLGRYGVPSLVSVSPVKNDVRTGAMHEYQIGGNRVRVSFLRYDSLNGDPAIPHEVEAELNLPDLRGGEPVVLVSTRVRRTSEGPHQSKLTLTGTYEREDMWDIPLLQQEERFNREKVHR